MSAESDVGKGLEAGHLQAGTSIQDQLSREVAFWSKERRQQSTETVIAPSRPVIRRRCLPRPAKNTPVSGEPARTRSKPFSMSYDGMTAAEYTQYLLDRGSR